MSPCTFEIPAADINRGQEEHVKNDLLGDRSALLKVPPQNDDGRGEVLLWSVFLVQPIAGDKLHSACGCCKERAHVHLTAHTTLDDVSDGGFWPRTRPGFYNWASSRNAVGIQTIVKNDRKR
jgi:hypothetical protein